MNPSTTNLETIQINQLKESHKLVGNALNKACTTGAFSLDDSFLIKVALQNLEKSVDSLDKYQTYVTEYTGKEGDDAPPADLEVLQINQLKDSHKLLSNALNKACTTGAFSLDDAFLIKVALQNLEKGVDNLDKYQTHVTEATKN